MDSDRLIILFFPFTGQDIKISISPPHPLLRIASELIGEYQVKIIDQRVVKNWKKELKHYLNLNPICLGISSMIGSQLKHALKTAKICKETHPEVPIVWGGIHVSTTPVQSIRNEYVDFIIKWEGEYSFLQLVNILENSKFPIEHNSKSYFELKKVKGLCFQYNNTIHNDQNMEFMDINKSKPTPWDLLNIEDYIHNGEIIDFGLERMLDIGLSTRGCPNGCKFCYHSCFDMNKYRMMTPEKTRDLFINNILKYNLDGVWLRDDNFYISSKHVEKVSKLLIEAKKEHNIDFKWYTSGIDIKSFGKLSDDQLKLLKESGNTSYRFGIESGSNRILKYIGKPFSVEEAIAANLRTKKFGLIPHYSFMGGFPTETTDELYQTLDLIDKLKSDNKDARLHQLAIFNPIPGTPLFFEAIKYGFEAYQSLEEYSEKSHFYSKKLKEFKHLLISETILNNITDSSYLLSSYLRFGFSKPIRPFISLLQRYIEYFWKKRKFKYRPVIKLYRYSRDILMKT